MTRIFLQWVPPGSTFKLIVAAAGLESKVIDKNFIVEDAGILKIGAFSFGNWYFLQYGKLDGEVNVVKAIQRSNDIFFYKLAELVGVDKLSQFAEKFGLGKKTGIDLIGEQSGTLPTQDWKKRVKESFKEHERMKSENEFVRYQQKNSFSDFILSCS